MKDTVAVSLFMLFVWIWVILFMIPFNNPVSLPFTLVPIVAIIINVLDSDKLTDETEKTMFQNSSVSVIILVIGLFLGAKVIEGKMDKRFARWLILAIVFVVFSSVDAWVSGNRTKALKYFRSLCEIFGVTIFVILMLEYFISVAEEVRSNKKANVSEALCSELIEEDSTVLLKEGIV